jgi:hypothetical protein
MEQILAVGEKIENLIVEKAGFVDDDELRFNYVPNPEATKVKLAGNGLLEIAIVHLQIIRLAYRGTIKGDIEKLKDYVFPRELPEKINNKINQLQTELKHLNS